MTRPLFLRRDYGGAILIAALILTSFAMFLLAMFGGWKAHEVYGPKPEPEVITEHVMVPVRPTSNWTCSRNERIEYLRTCVLRGRSELTKPRG